MTSADDLATLFTFAGKFGAGGKPDAQGPLGFHQGQVMAWDATTGANTIAVLGTTVNDVPVLSTSDSIMLTAGDTVGMLRFRSTYFLLGRIAPPGAGAALSTRQDYAPGTVSTTSSSSVALSGGPECVDVYVGSSRRALVFLSAQITVGNCYGHVSVAVSGASSIPAGGGGTPATVGGFDTGDTSSNGRVYIGNTATTIQVFDASTGLNEGLNTFSARYQRETEAGWTPVSAVNFLRRRLVVLPF